MSNYRGGGSSIQTNGDTLLIDKNREDQLYGALRRINYALTQRVSLDAPIAGTWTCIFFSFAVLVLVIALAITLSASVSRDLVVSSIEEAAIRS